MNTAFKRHQIVRIKRAPNPEEVEYHTENSDHEQTPIKVGMLGEVNLILQNGTYHVKILDETGKELAYAPFDEDDLEATD